MKKPPPLLSPRIIADLRAGEERGDPDHPGLRVRRTNAARVFFYRSRDGALREIKLGEFGPMTLAEARKALGRLRDALALVLLAGCRSGEVVAALWRDVGFGGLIVHVTSSDSFRGTGTFRQGRSYGFLTGSDLGPVTEWGQRYCKFPTYFS
ncbi:MAG: integrase family protein [Burkholderiales bacterium]|nr:integrase family protein [Burkholderiales bacterium]